LGKERGVWRGREKGGARGSWFKQKINLRGRVYLHGPGSKGEKTKSDRGRVGKARFISTAIIRKDLMRGRTAVKQDA